MLNWKKNEYKKNFVGILLLGIVLRILLSIFLGFESQKEWEYGAIADNLANGKGYSFYYFENNNLAYEYKNNANPSPSAYMPPGYVLELAGLKVISSGKTYSLLVFGLNLIFFAFTLFFLFKLTHALFGEKVAFASILIYSLIPEFIYTSYAVGTTQIYHLLIIMIFYFSVESVKSNKYTLAIILGFSLLFRSEIALLLLLIIIYKLIKKDYKQVLLLIVIPSIFISPWTIRNYIVFGKIIPFSTTSGLNLYRGNNEIEIGSWHNLNTLSKIHNFNGDTSKIELFLNKIYTKEALYYIEENPVEATLNFGKKILYFWVFNPFERESKNPIYYLPWLLMLSLGILGFIKSKEKSAIFYLIIIYHTAVATIFLPLMRYQTMMKVVLIPYVAFGLIKFIKKD